MPIILNSAVKDTNQKQTQIMQIQNSRIVNLYAELKNVLEDDYDHAWNFNLAGARNKRTLEPLAQDVQKQVREIQQEYGEPTEDGLYAFQSAEAKNEAKDEIRELEEKTREVEIETVKAEDVPNSLNGNQISGILEMIN
ncbi:hypothetical protein [Salinibacter grassmerensis]|uniref:hypothetical protein n=1 Tax=Salinibacter grassmerensis TaxID=3040353 RepID=UPI0021E71D2E|nr:hypothetical protein [Salinibacter grassmerensis]